MAAVKPIPPGLHTVTPSLTISDCAAAMKFYRKALGAVVVSNMKAPDGKSIWHAELRIGDSVIFCNDEMPGMTPTPPSIARPAQVSFWLSVKDCDATYRRAVKAGCTSLAAPQDMFWGDRCCGVADPFGFRWSFATRVKNLTPAEMRKGGREFAKRMAGG